MSKGIDFSGALLGLAKFLLRFSCLAVKASLRLYAFEELFRNTILIVDLKLFMLRIPQFINSTNTTRLYMMKKSQKVRQP